MKRLAFVAVVVMAVLVSAGACAPAPVQQAPQPVQKVRIAAVLPSTIDDLAWSQSMYEGLKAVQAELGEDKVEFTVSEGLYKVVDAGAAMRDYAARGYDIVIAHGSQYQNTVMEIAREFPNTIFAYGTGFKTADNVFAYDPQAQQGAYLLGIIAAGVTKTGKVGIVGAVEAGDAIKFSVGFKKGVAAANPDVEVLESYTGSFADTVGAREMAIAHMDAGADVLTGTAQQSVGAIKAVAERAGVYWLSNDMDQSSLAPDSVLAAQAYHWESVIRHIIDARTKGGKGEHLFLDFATGRLELVYNPRLENIIPDEVREQVAEARQAIISGELVIQLPKE